MVGTRQSSDEISCGLDVNIIDDDDNVIIRLEEHTKYFLNILNSILQIIKIFEAWVIDFDGLYIKINPSSPVYLRINEQVQYMQSGISFPQTLFLVTVDRGYSFETLFFGVP